MNRFFFTMFVPLWVFCALSAQVQGEVRYRQQRVQDAYPFKMEEAAELMAIGEATLKGQASMTSKKTLLQIVPGTKLYAREQQAFLFPMTSFLRAWVEKYASRGLFYGTFNLQPELDYVAARTLTDQEGRFQFRGLKPGKYLLWIVIPYEVEGTVAQETGAWQTTTFSTFGVVTAAVREPVTRAATAVFELENHVIHVVDIPPGEKLVDLGEIQGEEAGL